MAPAGRKPATHAPFRPTGVEMGGTNGVSERRATDWQRYLDAPSSADADRTKQIAAEVAPWARDYSGVASPRTPIGLVTVGPTGDVTFKTAVPAAPRGPQGEEATKHARLVAIVHPERRFSDLKPLTTEIFRIKSALARPLAPDVAQAAKQQLCMLQSQWVGLAKTGNIPEPRGRLDPMTAKPEEVARAFMWSEAGGVIPRAELEADGGKAFQNSVRDALTLRTRGFGALLDLHRARPDEQKSLLYRELKRLGVTTAPRPEDTVESLDARRREIVLARAAEEERKIEEAARRQLYIGLDGFVGTAQSLVSYERHEALQATNPGTTLGSIMATYLGGDDIQRMRTLGDLGTAVEGVAGGVSVAIDRARAERAPTGKTVQTGTEGAESRESASAAKEVKAPPAGHAQRSSSSRPTSRAAPPTTSAPPPTSGVGPNASVGSTPSFSARELAIIEEVRTIPRAQLRTLFEAGGGELAVGGRTVIVEPGMPASGMTLFGENAFVLGREAFTSDAELAKTLLHETQRLTTSRSGGGVSAELATSETEAAASFAARAYDRYFK
ncbi:MAG: hypothetical protein KF764_16695 [Labilithrix sp.]|nr:hypothetical protein [Labilithrix sp.]